MELIVDIEGWIIAGGESSRMGTDKAGLILSNEPLLELSGRALKPITGGRVFIAGDPRAFAPQYPAFPDRSLASRGPISGLLTALSVGNSEWIAVISCDMPFVVSEIYQILAAAISPEFDSVVPIQSDGRPQPLAALYRRKPVLAAVSRSMKEGRWALKELSAKVATRFVPFEELDELPNHENLFFNINSPADFAKAKQIASMVWHSPEKKGVY